MEFLVKLLWGLAAVAFVLFLMVALVKIFMNGSKDFEAKRNLELLVGRVKTVQEQHLGQPEASVLLQPPVSRVILGFDAGEKSPYGGMADRPSLCNGWFRSKDDACLCIGFVEAESTRPDAAYSWRPIECNRLPGIKRIVGTVQNDTVPKNWASDPGIILWSRDAGTYNLYISGYSGPKDVRIYLRDDELILDAAHTYVPSMFKPGGGDAGGAGASSSW